MMYFQSAKLAKNRHRSPEDYVRFQRFQARQLLRSTLSEPFLGGKTILDLGAGSGGYTLELARYAKEVCALDVKKVLMKVNFTIESVNTRFFPRLNLAAIPILNEFLTWHVEFVLRK